MKVLFVCVGNACRSPMAEKILNFHGKGKIVAESAGILDFLPDVDVDENTIEVMKEVGLDVSRHQPRHIRTVDLAPFDIVVNMSENDIGGYLGKSFKGKLINWNVTDPRGMRIQDYRTVRVSLAGRVQSLIYNLKIV